MSKLLIALSTTEAKWKGNTESIVFLIFGIVFIFLSVLSFMWMWYCLKNKIDENVAQNKNWFNRWIYKNRTLISIMVCLVIVVCAIVFMLSAFGIFIPITNPLD